MITVNSYLIFDGTCEAAFTFYKSVFGGEFEYIGKFKDMPADPDCEFSVVDREKIMHVSLPITKEIKLFGSDIPSERSSQFIQGTNFSLSINTDSKAEADTIFTALSTNGIVTMSMNKTFWGAYFGMITDQFGIQWTVNYDDPSKVQ
ncbi:VOC family protein [Flavobacterium sp.]